MMTIEDFTKELRNRVEERLGKNSTILITHTLKNNSVVQPQLVVQKAGSSISLAINLQDQYALYMKQPDNDRLDRIIENIIGFCGDQETEMDEVAKQAMRLIDYGYVKSRVLYKLVNTEYNQELLTQIPHIPYLDLSIVFYISMSETEKGYMTVLVNNQHMELWNITADELYQEAGKNTPEKMPARFCSLKDILNEDLEEGPADERGGELFQPQLCDGAPSFYILTNTVGIHGASAILYPGILKKCAEALQKDLVILPSSTHEVLLLPYREEIETEELAFMIQSINSENVPREDWLSDHAYLYRREGDKVTAA